MLNRLRRWVRNYFGFSKTETNGFIVLIPIMLLLLLAPTLFTRFFAKNYEMLETDKATLDSLVDQWNQNVRYTSLVPEEASPEIKLQKFNPNLADKSLLTSVGIPNFLVNRVMNYRSKGGKFRVKKDLGRIYDFPDSLLKVLTPFIDLPEKLVEEKRSNPSSSNEREEIKKEVNEVRVEVEEFSLIDINNADTTSFKKLRGIGSVYAARILKYRELLGGFVNIHQLAEVYGVKDSLVQSFEDRLVLDKGFSPRKLNINLATFKELRRHPYINNKQAQAILNVKSKYGKFQSNTDLERIDAFSESELNRLYPYINYK